MVAPYTTAELQERFDAECIQCHGPPQPDLMLDLSAPFSEGVVGVRAVELEINLITMTRQKVAPGVRRMRKKLL